MQQKLSFLSDGLKLSAVLHVPEKRRADERLPAFLVLHGFVGSKDESHAEIQARMLEEMGYAALRFDFRCCGESEGERGQVRCFDQVADGFGLGQVELVVQERTFGELAGFGEPQPDGAARLEAAREQQLQHDGAAVRLQLEHVFAGVRMRRRKMDR